MKTPHAQRATSASLAPAGDRRISTAGTGNAPAAAQRKSAATITNSPRQAAQRRSAQAHQPAAIQKRAKTAQRVDSKGLKAVSDNAGRKPAASREDYDALLLKGDTRAQQLNGQAHVAANNPNPPLRLTDMNKQNGMTITSVGSPIPGKENGHFVYHVISNVHTEDERIATYSNVFFLDSSYNIVGMKAGDNFKSNQPAERTVNVRTFDFYMSEVIELQYKIAQKAGDKQKGKFFKGIRSLNTINAADASLLAAPNQQALALPFKIARTPTPGTALTRALRYAAQNQKSAAEMQTVALGSEHGSLAFNICQSRGIAFDRLTIVATATGDVSFTINP